MDRRQDSPLSLPNTHRLTLLPHGHNQSPETWSLDRDSDRHHLLSGGDSSLWRLRDSLRQALAFGMHIQQVGSEGKYPFFCPIRLMMDEVVQSGPQLQCHVT